MERYASSKGTKDMIDIIALLKNGVDLEKYKKLIEKYKLNGYIQNLQNLLKQTYEVPELHILKHSFSKFKKEVLKALGS